MSDTTLAIGLPVAGILFLSMVEEGPEILERFRCHLIDETILMRIFHFFSLLHMSYFPED